jgi:hypothetical protein
MKKAFLLYLFLFIVIQLSSCLSFDETKAKSSIYISPSQASELSKLFEKLNQNDVIVLKEGTYFIDNIIRIRRKSNIIIKGEGKVRIIGTNEDMDIMMITDSKNIQISNVNMKHAKPPKGGCFGDVLHVGNSGNILLSNLELNGSGEIGLSIYDSYNVILENSQIHSNTIAAFHFVFNTMADGNVIRNNRIFNNPKLYTGSLSKEALDYHVKFKENNFD